VLFRRLGNASGNQARDVTFRSAFIGKSGKLRALFFVSLLGLAGCGGGGSSGTNVITTPPPPVPPTQSEINARYNFAPASRTVNGVAIYTSSGTVLNAANFLSGGTTRLAGNGSSVVVDFGKEVAGIVTMGFAGASDSAQQIGLAFSESSLYIGPISDRSNSGYGADGAIYADVSGAGTYTMPANKTRGGFRYLTLFLNSNGYVDLNQCSLAVPVSPAMPNLQAYPGYFYSNDDLLNRIWYSGAYTVQLDTIDPTTGRVYPPVPSGWQNDAVLGTGVSVVVDGAKRDRAIFSGDLAIAQPTAFVSTHDTDSAANTLDALYLLQKSTGEMPYAGPVVYFYGSDTYHLWSLIATADHYLYSNDRIWLDSHWAQYKNAVQYSLAKIDSNGLLNVNHPSDWGRTAPSSGEVIETNAMLYRVLTTGAELARVEADSASQTAYTTAAASLKQAINANLWDPIAGAYANLPGASLFPQDGNSLTLWYGIADSSQAAKIVTNLRHNWSQFGALTPEKPNAIAPFIGSMEVHGRFAAGDDQGALDLIRLEWGYMLNSNIGTQSTIWEGYLADGTLDATKSGGTTWYPYPFNVGSYMSLAHGWSTGPTSALTFSVVGISPAPGGEVAYTMIPHPGDLTHAEGAILIPSGTLKASWDHDAAKGAFTETISPPSGVLGTIGVPTFGKKAAVSVDQQLVWNDCLSPSSISNYGFANATTDGVYVYLNKMTGSHTINSNVPTTCP